MFSTMTILQNEHQITISEWFLEDYVTMLTQFDWWKFSHRIAMNFTILQFLLLLKLNLSEQKRLTWNQWKYEFYSLYWHVITVCSHAHCSEFTQESRWFPVMSSYFTPSFWQQINKVHQNENKCTEECKWLKPNQPGCFTL